MPDRAAIVTGAARGIGLALAEVLGEEGFGLTITARRPGPLEETAQALARKGFEVEYLAANLMDEAAVADVVAAHRARFGRLDVLVNNAGLGVAATAGEHQTKLVDLQLAVNVRAMILFYRECLQMLRAAGAEHRNAIVVNMASLAGKRSMSRLSVYGATKAAVISYTDSMNRELIGEGIKSIAFCPGWVDTEMSDFIKDTVPAEEMLRTEDIARALRFVLQLSPACVIPEIVFQRPSELL
jgi:short-subunit dehydrogenase